VGVFFSQVTSFPTFNSFFFKKTGSNSLLMYGFMGSLSSSDLFLFLLLIVSFFIKTGNNSLKLYSFLVESLFCIFLSWVLFGLPYFFFFFQ